MKEERLPMRLRVMAFPLLLFLAKFAFCTMPTSTVQLGANVENIHYSDDMDSAAITVQNTSQKVITAVDLKIEVAFKNGHRSNFEQLLDVLPAIASRHEVAGRGDLNEGGIVPGSTIDFTVHLQKGALAINATVNAITYLDLTGEGNSDTLKRIANNRQEYAEGLSDGVAIISAALADTATTDPRDMARRQLNQSLANLKGAQGKRTGMKEMAYKLMLDDLNRPLTNADLKAYALHRNEEAEYHFNHSKIRRTN
jgi:hypothetical protein